MNVQQELAARRDLVETALEELLPAERLPPATIHRAMRYSVLGNGKRLRGVLALAATEAVGGDSRRALPVAAALEMIHAYSLVHDDLPAMDDDDYRRGKPTSHKVFGEGMAVLAGDALLTHAFGLLANLPETSDVEPPSAIRILTEVTTACGTAGLIGGQVADLEAEGSPSVDLETLKAIHARKTGALFRACLRTGALVGGADTDQLKALTRYADEVGLAFQIIDDILDVEGDAARLGKTVGKDERSHKATYPSLCGLSEAKGMARDGVNRAKGAVDLLGEQAAFLKGVADYVLQRDH